MRRDTNNSSEVAPTQVDQQKIAEHVKLEFDQVSAYYATEREHSRAYQLQASHVLRAVPPGCLRVLDIGAGPALLADQLISRGAVYYAVDVSLEMLKWGQKCHPQQNVHCMLADATSLCCADGCVDVIVAMGVLEYVPEPTSALREFWRVLSRRGIAVITVPNAQCLYDISKQIYWQTSTNTKRLLALRSKENAQLGVGCELPHRFGPAVWQEMAEESDFEVTAIAFCDSRMIAHPFAKWLPHLDDWLGRHTDFLCGLSGASRICSQLIMQLHKT